MPLHALPDKITRMFTIRLMTGKDIPSVTAIQAECYAPAAIESETVFRARLPLAPQFAWVAEDKHGVCAYLVAYPSQLGKVTPLGSNFTIPETPDALYLHDLAVSRRVSGNRLGTHLVRFALDAGRRHGLNCSALVSIQDSANFWQSHGYADWHKLDEWQRKHMETYPQPACYLVRELI